MTSDQASANTDRELWRARDGDYYADSVHVTSDEAIGLQHGGWVVVKPVLAWLNLDQRVQRLTTMLAEVCVEYEDACEYKGEYFTKKHGDRELIAEARELIRLAKTEEPLATERARVNELQPLRITCDQAREPAGQDGGTMTKLWKVTLRGLAGSTHRVCYVVADDSQAAYAKVRADLDRRDYGFRRDRMLDQIELIAEDNEYTETPSRLYL